MTLTLGQKIQTKLLYQLWVSATALALVTMTFPVSAQTNGPEPEQLPASAQSDETEPEQPPPTEATMLFEAGRVAFRDGRPADAQDLFRRSLTLQPTPAAAWNLTLALRATNDLVEAVQLARQLLNEEHGQLEEEQRTQIGTLLDELLRRVAVLDITTNHSAEVIATVDGVRVGVVTPEQGLEHVTDPGEHLVSGSAPDARTTEQSVVAPAGAHTDVLLSLELMAEPVVETPPPRRWWIWVLVTTVAVGVATGLALGLSLRDEPEMLTNSLWGERGYIEALTAANAR